MSEPARIRSNGRPPSGKQPCTTPGCEGSYGSRMPKGQTGGRGLCKRCLMQASALVKRNVTTWKELEDMNLAIPPYRSDYERIFQKAKKEMTSAEEPT